MTVVTAVSLLAQPQFEDKTNYSIFWVIIAVLSVAVVVLSWRNFAKPKPAPSETGPAAGPVRVKPSCEPLRLLAILQREGRLVDFFLEDVDGYTDEQIGAAVRDIHRNCRKVLREHLTLEPVLPEAEGAAVTIPAGFDPSAVRVTGNVTGQPPFTGTLRHHGWRVKELRIAAPPVGQDEFVVQPAEVELT
jgi:Domain of unknown function (DUF2760)